MDNRLKGIICMLISALFFTFMSILLKYIPNIPIFEKVLFRNLVSLLIAFYSLMRTENGLKVSKENIRPLFERSFLGYIGVVTNFYAINNLPLANSNILNKLSPITVTIFAYFVLKEKVDKYQVLGIIFTFIGAIFVIKPSLTLDVLPSLAGLISVVLSGYSYCIIRFLKDKESPHTIVFYFSLLSVILSIPMVMMNFVMPTPMEALTLLGIGVMAGIFQFALTFSYKLGEASEMVVYNYFGIVFGVIFGYLIFKEIPDIYTIIGGTIIVVVAILLYFHNKKKA